MHASIAIARVYDGYRLCATVTAAPVPSLSSRSSSLRRWARHLSSQPFFAAGSGVESSEAAGGGGAVASEAEVVAQAESARAAKSRRFMFVPRTENGRPHLRKVRAAGSRPQARER